MYIMYVDESGDSGALPGSPSNTFILTGIVVHEQKWYDLYNQLLDFRLRMRNLYGLRLTDEIHTTQWFGRRQILRNPRRAGNFPPNVRLAIYRQFLEEIASMRYLRVINVLVDKIDKDPTYDVFFNAWRALFQRFENTLLRRNFPDGYDTNESGLVICDHTDGTKLRDYIKNLRVRNIITPSPARGGIGFNQPFTQLIEDPILRDSRHSYFVQMADVSVFSLKQYLGPNTFFRTKPGRNYFRLLEPVLCTHASHANYLGMVRL